MTAAIQTSAPRTSPGRLGLRPWNSRDAFQTMPQVDEADGVQRQRKHIAEHRACQRPERHRRCAQQIGRSPPLQCRDILLKTEEQQHQSQQAPRSSWRRDKAWKYRATWGHRMIVMQNSWRGENRNGRRRHLRRYDRRVGNPFAFMRKFSGKTASTHRQMRKEKAPASGRFRFPGYAAFAANFNEAISASRTGTTCAPWRGRTSCARPRASRG